MKFQNVKIATARIKGLRRSPYYSHEEGYYVWDIMFERCSTLYFNDLFVKVGNNEEEGKTFCEQLKKNFNQAHIFDENKVAVIFGDDDCVLAIGNIGEDVWIDATDKFVRKTFAQLNINITSLKVY